MQRQRNRVTKSPAYDVEAFTVVKDNVEAFKRGTKLPSNRFQMTFGPTFCLLQLAEF